MTRPKKAAADLRAIVLRVRVTAEERALLQAAADRERLDLSTWLRQFALKGAEELTAGKAARKK